ncbi:hypothetical protein [Phage Phass-1]|uniref:Uncharacterized protein n=1 Tax=Phage Phass-1 TaxID=3043662 RepID=A0AAF0LZH5_9CAUD|nr:hypothetical protein [Phage Phass-1]
MYLVIRTNNRKELSLSSSCIVVRIDLFHLDLPFLILITL